MNFIYSAYFYIPVILFFSVAGIYLLYILYAIKKFNSSNMEYFSEKSKKKKKKKKHKKKKIDNEIVVANEVINKDKNPERILYSDIDFNDYKLKGNSFEHDCVNVLEDLDFDVDWRGLDLGFNDGGIDIVATKDNNMFLLQCKNWKESSEVTDKHLRVFYGDVNVYREENNLSEYIVYPVFITKHYQLAYNGKMWIKNKNVTYFDFKEFKEFMQKHFLSS